MLVVEPRKDGYARVKTVFTGETRTEQSHRDEVDINKIVARARRGILPRFSGVQPNYGDFSSGQDYMDVAMRVADARSDFEHLPADIRKMFGNDVAAMIEFMADPDNREEAEELGLIAKPQEAREAVAKVEPTPPPAGGEESPPETPVAE